MTAPRASRKSRVLRQIARLGRPLSMPFAGIGLIAVWGVLEHVGRKSGRTYRIPVAMIRTTHGFIIPVPFGAATQWSRNVLAAGGCTIGWRRRDYPTVDPRLVDWPAVRDAFPRPLRPIVRVVGIRTFMKLRDAAA